MSTRPLRKGREKEGRRREDGITAKRETERGVGTRGRGEHSGEGSPSHTRAGDKLFPHFMAR